MMDRHLYRAAFPSYSPSPQVGFKNSISGSRTKGSTNLLVRSTPRFQRPIRRESGDTYSSGDVDFEVKINVVDLIWLVVLIATTIWALGSNFMVTAGFAIWLSSVL